MNAALALARYLSSAGLATFNETTPGGDTYLNALPADGPDLALAVVPTGGNPVEGDSRLGWDEPTVQLLVRSPADDRLAGIEWAARLYDHLQGWHGVMDGISVCRVRSMQTAPAFVGLDELGRPRYSLNLALHIRAVTANRE